MLQDLLDAARNQAAERLASPILGSFAVSWCIWNYKFLVILFSDATVTQTFALIKSESFPDISSVLLYGVFFPLLTAAAYIFAYPYPARFVYGFTRRRQKEVLELKRAIEEETPLTIEESRLLRSDAHRLQTKHLEEIDRLRSELSRLSQQAPQQPSPSPAAVQPSQVPPSESAPLEPLQFQMLNMIDSQQGGATVHRIIQVTSLPRVKVEFALGELEGAGLVKSKYEQDEEDVVYRFTHEGRRAYLYTSSRMAEANKGA